jgi:hypothetical protein
LFHFSILSIQTSIAFFPSPLSPILNVILSSISFPSVPFSFFFHHLSPFLSTIPSTIPFPQFLHDNHVLVGSSIYLRPHNMIIM